jgi:hypothetical protein
MMVDMTSRVHDEYGRLLRETVDELFRCASEGRVFAPIKRIEEYINDFELAPDEQGVEVDLRVMPDVNPLEPIDGVLPMVAVDSSLAILGESDVGVIVAFRCAFTYSGVDRPRETFEYLAHFTEGNRHIYSRLRRLLGSRGNSAGSLDRMPYRIMNLLERIAQRRACTQITGGIVLWDGSLTRTMETTRNIYEDSFRLAQANGNSIVAISKRSRLRLQTGEKITTLLDDRAGACISEIHTQLPSKIQGDLLGRVHVVKFSEEGFTFRVDVVPAPGLNCCEVIRRLAGATTFTHGYPSPLREAHIEAYFTGTEIMALQSLAMDRYQLRPADVFDVRTHIFGPFG